MSDLYQTCLNAGAASANGAVFNVTGAQTFWGFEVLLDASAATLQGVLQFNAAIELPTLPLTQQGAWIVQRTTNQTGFTVGATTGTLTFNNPNVGRSSMIFSANTPLRLIQPIWTYTSGGGTVVLRVIGWGSTFA